MNDVRSVAECLHKFLNGARALVRKKKELPSSIILKKLFEYFVHTAF